MVPIKKLVGHNIKAARETRGMTQFDLGKAIGTEPTSISRYETGRVTPGFETLTAIGRVVGHDLAWFYTDHSAVEPAPEAAA